MKRQIDLKEQLQEELLALSFHGFEQCVRVLLKQMGYSEVALMGRTHFKQFTRHGGLDMQARSRLGVTETPVILQLKQYRRPVSRRFVDELRGTMLRLGAGHGLIISTSTFSPVARKVAQSELAPIRLIDGKELIDLLREYRIGVRPKGKRGGKLDKRFFQKLRKQYPAKAAKAGSSLPQTRASLSTRHVDLTSTSYPGDPMLWRTHVAAGIGSLWLLSAVPGSLTHDNIALLAGLSALGALLPDLDSTESKIKHLSLAKVQPFAPVSSLLHQTFGHRGRLHSLAGLAAATAIALPLSIWWGWQAPLAVSLGYSSHLLLDACTRTGIPILSPKHRFYALPRKLRISTGSLAEEAIFPLLALLVMILLLRFIPSL